MYTFKTAPTPILTLIIDRIETWMFENNYTDIDRTFVMRDAIVMVLDDDRSFHFGTDGVILLIEDDDPYVTGSVPAIPNLLRTRS